MEAINGTSSVHVCHMDDSLMTSQHPPPPLVGQQTFCALLIVNSVPESRLLIVFFHETVEMQFVRMGTRLSVVLVTADILPTMRTVVPEQCGLVMCELNTRPVVRVTREETACSSTEAHMLAFINRYTGMKNIRFSLKTEKPIFFFLVYFNDT